MVVVAVAGVGAGAVLRIRRLLMVGTPTRERITPADRTEGVVEVGLGAVEVAAGAVGTTGTQRRTLRSSPTCEGINARYVCGIVRVSVRKTPRREASHLYTVSARPSSLIRTCACRQRWMRRTEERR